MVDPWVRRACWLAAWVAAGGCGPKAKVEGPVDGLAFSGDGSVVIAGSRRSGAIAVDTKGRARPIAVTDVARWTLSTDGAVAIGAAAEGFVVVDVASGSVTPVPVGERDGEPHQMFRTPAGDIAITKLVHSWRVHRWTPDQPTDPSPLILDQLRGAWVDRRGEVFFLDTGYGLQIREVATGRLLRTVDRRSDPQRYVDAALDAMTSLTERFTSEFAVRPWLRRFPDTVLARMHTLTTHPSEHVRRWVSEGTRPRLPSSSRMLAGGAQGRGWGVREGGGGEG